MRACFRCTVQFVEQQAATWHPPGEFPAPSFDEVKEPLSAKAWARVNMDLKLFSPQLFGTIHRRRLEETSAVTQAWHIFAFVTRRAYGPRQEHRGDGR